MRGRGGGGVKLFVYAYQCAMRWVMADNMLHEHCGEGFLSGEVEGGGGNLRLGWDTYTSC